MKEIELKYETRDGKGNDIIKMVQVKEFPADETEFECRICRKHFERGIKAKKIISGNFTDFAYIGEYICEECSKLFSLYFYNYIVDPDGIRLLNVRQLKEELCKKQKPPFRFIITTTQKKHLFYRSIENYSPDRFAVNLETEIIYTDCERMKQLFDFVECMIALGASKKGMEQGEIPFPVIKKTGFGALEFLQEELKESREIRIPLYCGQKTEMEEEEALCIINSILTAEKEEKQR